MSIKYGGDPEFFVVNSNGEGVGAFHFFPGTKYDPYPLDGGNVQVDGFAVEIGIDPVDRIKDIPDRVASLVEQCKYFIPKDHKFAFTPYMDFKPDYFAEVDEQFKVIGCEPSWNCHTNKELLVPEVATSTRRYAGGHIHLGWTEGLDVDDPIVRSSVSSLAYNLTCYCSERMDSGATYVEYEKAQTRLREYDIGHSIRVKPYGVELRRPAPYWANPNRRSTCVNLFSQIREEIRYAGGEAL